MPNFSPRRVIDYDQRISQIENYLSRLGNNPISAAVEGQNDGLNTPATAPSLGIENFSDLQDVDDSGAAEGYIPVYTGGTYVVTDWTPAAFGFGGQSSPTAWVHIGVGTAAAGTSPLKLTSGTNLTSPEAGSVEYDGTELYFTRASTRLKVLMDTPVDGTNITLGTVTGTKIGVATNNKIGFFGAAPVVRPAAYTPVNVTVDRSWDSDATTLDELSDVVGTLVADLQSLGLIG